MKLIYEFGVYEPELSVNECPGLSLSLSLRLHKSIG